MKIQHPLLNWTPVETPFGADYFTCPQCENMFEPFDDEEDPEFTVGVTTCPQCKLCFEIGCVYVRGGCTDSTYYPRVYVKKGTAKELLYLKPEQKLTDKMLEEEYDAVCLCEKHSSHPLPEPKKTAQVYWKRLAPYAYPGN